MDSSGGLNSGISDGSRSSFENATGFSSVDIVSGTADDEGLSEDSCQGLSSLELGGIVVSLI